MDLAVNPDAVKGFLDPAEGAHLYDLGRQAGALGPCLEVGSYCGKSTLYLGSGVRAAGGQLFALDHHRGSEEHQDGESYHDPDLIDSTTGRFDSLPVFRQTLALADLEQTVIPIIGTSVQVGRLWRIPLSLVFVDGGHSFTAAHTDLNAWMPHILPGGFLTIHDIFDTPETGGQAPREIYEMALNSGLFITHSRVKTLGVLQRRRI